MSGDGIRAHVVCTDRGRHPRISLGHLAGWAAEPPGEHHPDRPTHYGRRADTPTKMASTAGARKMKELLPEVELDDAGVVQWRCPRCGRNPQIKPDKANQLWAGLVRNGTFELDISALPF